MHPSAPWLLSQRSSDGSVTPDHDDPDRTPIDAGIFGHPPYTHTPSMMQHGCPKWIPRYCGLSFQPCAGVWPLYTDSCEQCVRVTHGTSSRPRTRLVSLPVARVKLCSVLRIRWQGAEWGLFSRHQHATRSMFPVQIPAVCKVHKLPTVTCLPNLHFLFPYARFLRSDPCDQ